MVETKQMLETPAMSKQDSKVAQKPTLEVPELLDFMDMGDVAIEGTIEDIKKMRIVCSFSADYCNSIVETLLKSPKYSGKSFEGLKLSLKRWFPASVKNQVAFSLRVTENSAKSVKQ